MMVIDPDQRVDPRICAYDPGTNTLGCAVLKLIPTGLLVEHAHTLQIGKLFNNYPLIIERHGERVAKLHATTDAVLKFLSAWNPTFTASEGPYMGSFPTAFAALVESVDAIRRALILYDPFMSLSVSDPTTVKKTIGITGRINGDKEKVRKALSEQTILTFAPGVVLADLDEHSVDAIAVGVAFYLNEL